MPEQYRRSFIAGFIDGNGHYLTEDMQYELPSTHKSTLLSIKQCAQSLAICVSDITHKNVINVDTGKSFSRFRMWLSGVRIRDLAQYIRLECKRAQLQIEYSERVMQQNNSWTFSIESLGEGQYYGFTVDGNSRFLLGDYTVTHNVCRS